MHPCTSCMSPGAANSVRSNPPDRRVAIVQRIVPHYRVPFFYLLNRRLMAHNVKMDVIAGQPRADEALDDCRRNLNCAISVKNYYLLGGVYWQPILSLLSRYDTVVVEHANTALANHLLLLRRRFMDLLPQVV